MNPDKSHRREWEFHVRLSWRWGVELEFDAAFAIDHVSRRCEVSLINQQNRAKISYSWIRNKLEEISAIRDTIHVIQSQFGFAQDRLRVAYRNIGYFTSIQIETKGNFIQRQSQLENRALGRKIGLLVRLDRIYQVNTGKNNQSIDILILGGSKESLIVIKLSNIFTKVFWLKLMNSLLTLTSISDWTPLYKFEV